MVIHPRLLDDLGILGNPDTLDLLDILGNPDALSLLGAPALRPHFLPPHIQNYPLFSLPHLRLRNV